MRDEAQLYTATGAAFRRTLGSRCKASGVPTSVNRGQLIAYLLRNGNKACRSRGGAKHSAHRFAVSQRRGNANLNSSTNRRKSAFGAAGIHRRREIQRAQVMEALATALWPQADVLAGFVS